MLLELTTLDMQQVVKDLSAADFAYVVRRIENSLVDLSDAQIWAEWKTTSAATGVPDDLGHLDLLAEPIDV